MRILPRPAVAVVLSALLALTTAACSTGSTATPTTTSDSSSEADANAYPVTIEHAFGSTTIEEEPTRVVTLGWTDHDVVLSLGVVPVGATKLTWGGN
ncbi:MAG: iron-siderophore ABC transporter substrate-binding protein, partial [Nocardioides sp.]|nr:iron-siderophore ABC transporter substrate-binding protein [Nocardioides sp.]